MFFRIAAVVSSLLLAGVYVYGRAGGQLWAGSKPNQTQQAQTAQPKRVLPSSKSAPVAGDWAVDNRRPARQAVTAPKQPAAKSVRTGSPRRGDGSPPAAEDAAGRTSRSKAAQPTQQKSPPQKQQQSKPRDVLPSSKSVNLHLMKVPEDGIIRLLPTPIDEL